MSGEIEVGRERPNGQQRHGCELTRTLGSLERLAGNSSCRSLVLRFRAPALASILMWRRRMRRLLLSVACVGCSAASHPAPDIAPRPPGKADSDYTINGNKTWYLIGDGLTPGDDRVELTVQAPATTQFVDLWLDGQFVTRTTAAPEGFAFSVPLDNVAAGPHDVLLAADGASTAFGEVTFQRSAPLYVDVTNDWDTGDHGDDKLERQDRLHANHPHLVLTHFVGPYMYGPRTFLRMGQ
jgi:hypothetical protein